MALKIVTAGPIASNFEPAFRRLLASAGIEALLEIEALPESAQRALQNWDGDGWVDCHLFETVEALGQTKKILWSCGHDLKYKAGFLKLRPTAFFGCSDGESYAVEYAPEDYRLGTQIHEALHLLGVDDCYDKEALIPLPSCTLDECVMRYGGNSTVVCSSVIEQLRQTRYPA